MKNCPKCNVDKPESDFGPQKLGKGGLNSSCRECGNAAARAYSKTPEGRAARAAYLKTDKGVSVVFRSNKKTRSRHQVAFDALKSKVGCYRCGNRDPFVLTFHHVDPSKKKFAIKPYSSTASNYGEEVSKCVCLCFNCHAIAHRVFGTKCIIGKEQLNAIRD